MAKGSNFEREICKKLSLWWSGGKRDDIFWRSQTSGGRATQRMKSGKTTYGSYGDVAAVDPIGEPLLQVFTIELKRGRSHGNVLEVIDCPDRNCQQKFEETLTQTHRSHKDAGSLGWMLISRRDRRIPVAYFDFKTARFLFPEVLEPPKVIYSLPIRMGKGEKKILKFVSTPLDLLLDRLAPIRVQRLAEQQFGDFVRFSGRDNKPRERTN